jgi:hypothetical protein
VREPLVHVVLAWFGDGAVPVEARRRARERFDESVSGLVAETFVRHDFGGDDWGVTVLYPSRRDGYRWPVFAQEGSITAVSLGIPVGLDVAGGPARLARCLLAGGQIHATVVPPFGLMAFDAGRRFAVQQDWLGMCRLFVGSGAGVTAMCSRPSLLASFLGGTATPDHSAWSSYAVCGHFGGDMSPIGGIRLLGPGERITGVQRPGGGWHVVSDIRYGVDDVVAAGIAARGTALDVVLDRAADQFRASASAIYDIYDAEVTVGLSGGKDSRVVAAAVLAAGRMPQLATNVDDAFEGEVARRLVEILRHRRGPQPAHRLRLAAAPADVLSVGLYERVSLMHHLYDYQYSSTFTVRPWGARRFPDAPRVPSLSGAGGELAIGYWYPPGDDDQGRSAAARAAMSRHCAAVPIRAASAGALAAEQDRIRSVLDHAAGLGLDGLDLADYVYLVERVRRWYNSAYAIGMITPFLCPGFVSATFTLTPAQKRRRLLHAGLLERFMPEWAEVPYALAAGRSTATRISDGDGVKVICDLLDTAGGDLAGLLRRDEVERTVSACVWGIGPFDPRIMQHFASLAVASHRLEPWTRAPSTTATYTRIMTAAQSTGVYHPLSRLANRVRFVKRTSLGRWLWTAIRVRAMRAERRRLTRVAQRTRP